MRNAAFALAIGVGGLASSALADTQQIAVTGYTVVTKMAEKFTFPDGRTVMAGEENHSTLVNDKTGETTSQWCSGDAYPDAAGKVTSFVSRCTVVYDAGDAVWLSVVGGAEDQPANWTIVGGTGRFVGATGGGTARVVSRRGDGYGFTQKATGTLTTK